MSLRRILTLVALLIAAGVFVGQVRKLLADPTIWPPDDFIEYWAAAKLALDGQNPYDEKLLLPLQQANGRDTEQAIMMWNPPWALPVVLPLGLVPAREAQLLWLAVNLAAIAFCGDRLWLLLGGAQSRRWIGWLSALVAMPTLFALQAGQIGPLVLLGAVLFLECERRGWHFAAGAATVLLAIKPHLAYLVWLAIICDAVVRDRWRIVIGGAVAGVAFSLAPLALNTQVWNQYADALANRTPDEWLMPTIGSILRLAFGEGLFGLQFVPVLAGLAWFTWHWRKSGKDWNWGEQLPLLLLVSFLTAPYGAWPFDMVLLLPAVVVLLARVESPNRIPVIVSLIVINVACLVLNVLKISSFWFVWVAPAVLVLYIAGMRTRTPAAHHEDAPVLDESKAVAV
jgi:glycosyl transferase family 87